METTNTIEFSKSEFLAIGWSMAEVIFKDCPSCNQRNTIKSKDITNEGTVICDNCGTPIQLKYTGRTT